MCVYQLLTVWIDHVKYNKCCNCSLVCLMPQKRELCSCIPWGLSRIDVRQARAKQVVVNIMNCPSKVASRRGNVPAGNSS